MDTIVTPVDTEKFKDLLEASGYPVAKSQYLINGFNNGFSIGYEGDDKVKRTAANLKLNIGNETVLWNKVMKEVKTGRYAGPFQKIPFDYYIQSPIGLVPKDGGCETRLIFHLSYPRNGLKQSVNVNTPPEKCRVTYCDIDMAVRLCLAEGVNCSLSKADMKSAFHNLGILKQHWRYLVMKVRDPRDGKTWYFFVNKCLPFGAAISCTVFQAFSDAIAYLVKW